ncbi:MAG: histidine phosphatase family protein [Erysipelotrichaceae bacterium]
MNLYVMRHGQTDWNIDKRTQGLVDIPLNQTGIQQAKAAIKQIKDICFDLVYSSPLQRAVKTAEIVTEGKYLIIIDDLLIERSFGDMEGLSASQFDVNAFLSRPLDKSYNNEETHQHMIERAKKFIDKLPDVDNVLIVTHGAYYRALMMALDESLKNGDYISLFLKNCEIQKIEMEKYR